MVVMVVVVVVWGRGCDGWRERVTACAPLDFQARQEPSSSFVQSSPSLFKRRHSGSEQDAEAPIRRHRQR